MRVPFAVILAIIAALFIFFQDDTDVVRQAGAAAPYLPALAAQSSLSDATVGSILGQLSVDCSVPYQGLTVVGWLIARKR